MATPGLAPSSTWPRYLTSPLVGAISPAMQRNSVLLPDPLRPSSATISPSCSVSEMSSSTGSGLPSGDVNVLSTCDTSMMAS